MTTISNNLRKFRERNTNLGQKEIAELLGIKQNTYSTWESGEVDVKSEYIPKLAEILKVEIKDLFENASKKIIINQSNSENKDNSVNGLVFVLSDSQSVNELIEVLRKNL